MTGLADRIDEIRRTAITINVAGIEHRELPRLDGEEAVALCPECEALVWIADPGELGELYLMRICEVETEDCVTCTRARAAVHDPDIEEAIREALEDD